MFGGDSSSDVVPRRNVKSFVDAIKCIISTPNTRHSDADAIVCVGTERKGIYELRPGKIGKEPQFSESRQTVTKPKNAKMHLNVYLNTTDAPERRYRFISLSRNFRVSIFC
jgi:hypothetical protein